MFNTYESRPAGDRTAHENSVQLANTEYQNSRNSQPKSRYADTVKALCLGKQNEPADAQALREKLLLARDVCTAQAARLASESTSLDLIGIYRLGSLIAGEAAFSLHADKLNEAYACARLGYQYGQAIEKLGVAL
jgi:hypothetical protein